MVLFHCWMIHFVKRSSFQFDVGGRLCVLTNRLRGWGKFMEMIKVCVKWNIKCTPVLSAVGVNKTQIRNYISSTFCSFFALCVVCLSICSLVLFCVDMLFSCRIILIRETWYQNSDCTVYTLPIFPYFVLLILIWIPINRNHFPN